MTVSVKGKLWKYPGVGGWHFFTVHKSISQTIKQLMRGRLRGFGSIRVRAKIGKSEWGTSLFPTKEGTYLLPVKASVREREEVAAGDTIKVHLSILGA
jgi:hypothetical protein